MGNRPAILIVGDDRSSEDLAFPLGHPVRGRAYVAHPMWPHRYLPVDEASELLAREKVQVFQQVAGALGARRIELVRVVEREATGKAAVKLPLLKALLGIGGGRKQASTDTTQDTIEFAAPPLVPFEPARFGRWTERDADLCALVELHRTTRPRSHEHELETTDLQGIDGNVAIQIASLGVERTRSERVRWRFRIEYFGDARSPAVPRATWSLAAGAWLGRVATERIPGRAGIVVAELAAETTAVLVDRSGGVAATYHGPAEVDARELAGHRFDEVVLLDARPVLVRAAIELPGPIAACTAVVVDATAAITDIGAVLRDARGSAEVSSHSIARQVERLLRDAVTTTAAIGLDDLREQAGRALAVALPALDVQLRVSARRHLRSIDVAIGDAGVPALDRDGRPLVGTVVVTFDSDAAMVDVDVAAIGRQVGELVRAAVRTRGFDDFDRARAELEEAVRPAVAVAMQRAGAALRELGVLSLGDRLEDAREELLAAREWMELDYERDELEALAREQMLARRRRDAAVELAAAAVAAEVAIGKAQLDAQVRLARARADAEVDVAEAHGATRVVEALTAVAVVRPAGDDDDCPVRLELDRTALDGVRAGERFLLNLRAIARSVDHVTAQIQVGSTPAAIDLRLDVRAGKVGRPSKPVAAEVVLAQPGAYRLDGHVTIGEQRWWFSETLRVYAPGAGAREVFQQAKFIANLDDGGGWRALELHLDDEPAPVAVAPPCRFAPAFTARLRTRAVPDQAWIAGARVGDVDVARLLERGAITGYLREHGQIIVSTQAEVLALCGEPVAVAPPPRPEGADRRTVDALVAFHRAGDRGPARRIADTPDDDETFRDYVEEALVLRTCLGEDAARAYLRARAPTALAYTPFCAAAWLVVFDDRARAREAHDAAPRPFVGEAVNALMHLLAWSHILREALLDDEALAVLAEVERDATDGWMLVQVAEAWLEIAANTAQARRVLEAAERSPSTGPIDAVAIAKCWHGPLRDPVRARRLLDGFEPRVSDAFDLVNLGEGYQDVLGDDAAMRRCLDRAADRACASDHSIQFDLSWVFQAVRKRLAPAEAVRLLDRAERAATTRDSREAIAALRAEV